MLPEACAQMISRRTVGEPPGKQSGLMNAQQFTFVPLLIDRHDRFGIWHECPHHRYVPFDMKPEIMERVGVTTLDHRVGFLRQRGHAARASWRAKIRKAPLTGTRTQSGR